MRILMIHNYYQLAGGEDVVFAAESQMLRDNGHEVFQYTDHNNKLQGLSPIKAVGKMLWAQDSQKAIAAEIAAVKPDIVHFHNTFMAISPAAYYACKAAKLPVIQSLHNYRLICPKATLYRDGANCTSCLNSPFYWPAIQHACYRDSRLQSGAVALMLNFHKLIKSYEKQVDSYICLSEGQKRLLVAGGLNPAKLVVKGNFLESDPGYSQKDENFFLFLGRLVPEKGLRVLLEAWQHLPNIPLKILGDGELREEIMRTIEAHNLSQVEFVGQLPRQEALALLQRASALIIPSQWQEPFGMVAIEAFASGKAVIASKIGALGDMFADGELGLHFEAHNPSALAEKAKWLWENPSARQTMGERARQVYEAQYSSSANYQALLSIYEAAISTNAKQKNTD